MTSPKRVAIVTGAAEGIGRAIATRLAKDGFDLGLFDLPRAQPRLVALAEELKNAHGTRIALAEGDVSKEEDVKRLVDTVVGELGGVYAVSQLWPRWRTSRKQATLTRGRTDDRKRRDIENV